MKLNRIVQVDVTQEEAVDYLRATLKYSKYNQGDAIEVVEDCARFESGLSLFAVSKRYHATKGMIGVVDRYDQSDNTYLCLFINLRGIREYQWMEDDKIRLWQKMPADWIPTEVSLEALRAAKVAGDEASNRSDPLGSPEPPEEEGDDIPVRSPRDALADAIARAEAGVASGRMRTKR